MIPSVSSNRRALECGQGPLVTSITCRGLGRERGADCDGATCRVVGDQGSDVVVDTPLPRRWFLVGLTAVMTAASLLVVFNAPWVARAAGVVALAFSGLCTLYALLRALRPKPPVVVGSDGFIDQATAVAVGFIPWQEVAHVRASVVVGQSTVVVTLRDPDRLIRRQPFWKRPILRMNRKFSGDVFIPGGVLSMTCAELVEIMQARRVAAGGGSG